MSLSAVRWLNHATAQRGTRLAEKLGAVCVITMICASFTVQPITTASSPLWIKAEQLILPIALLGYLWLLLAGLARTIRLNGMFAVGAIYFASVLISMWYGSALLQGPVILRDFFEFPKILLPVAFFTLTYEAELSEAALQGLLKFYGVAILFVCFYAWAQWWGLGISYYLNQFYSSGVHDDALISARRVYATMGNPNVLGQLVTWAMAAFTLAAIYKVGNRTWNAFIALACLVVLAMTGSRYGVLDGCLALGLIYWLSSQNPVKRPVKGGYFLVAIAAFVVLFAVVTLSNQATLSRFQTLSSPLQVDSLQGRVGGSWRTAGVDILRSPLFGRGPSKFVYAGTFTDSEYLDVLKRFGFVGLSCYLLYFLYPLKVFAKGLRAIPRAGPFLEERLPATLLTLRFATIIVVTCLVMNIGMSSLYNAQIQGFLWMWMGLGARCAKTVVDTAMAHTVVPRRVANEPFPEFPEKRLLLPWNRVRAQQ